MAQERVFEILASKGIVSIGTLLEIVPDALPPDALPPDALSHDPRVFQARVIDPAIRRRSLVWEFDGQPYSPTELTCRLWGDYKVISVGPSYYSHWRVVGRGPSLWEESRAVAK